MHINKESPPSACEGTQQRAHKRTAPRGQSMVETALFFMVLLTLLTGVIEVAVAVNAYLTVIQAAREGARSAVSTTPDLTNCTNTTYADQLASAISLRVQTTVSGTLTLSSSNATIIVTRVRTSTSGSSVTVDCYHTYTDPDLGSDASRFNQSEVASRIQQIASLASGEDEFVIVEFFYHYQFFLAPINIPMYSYTIMRVIGT